MTNELGRAIEPLKRAVILAGSGPWKDPPSAYLVTIWSEVFGVPRNEQHPELDQALHSAVAEALVQLRGALVRSQARMATTNLAEDMYSPAFEAALRATSPAMLLHRAQEMQVLLTREYIDKLRWCSAAIGVEENPLDPADLDHLVEMLDELDKEVASHTSLSPVIKSFFFDAIARLRKMLREYPLRGMEAWREGYFQVFGQWALQAAAHQEAAPKEERKLWEKFNDMMTVVSNLQKAGEVAYKAAIWGPPIVHAALHSPLGQRLIGGG